VLLGLISSDFTVWQNLILIAVFALALLCAIIPHEIAHGYAALKMGDPSAKLAGRLSPNPARHIDPWGLACFVIMGIGWAKPVPVNPFNFRNFRRGNFWVSIAGVLTNLVIGFVMSLFLFLVWRFGNIGNVGIFALYYFFGFVVVINITLMIFNLLPIFPLDGFNVLNSFTKPDNRAMNFIRQYSPFILISMLLVLMFTGVLAWARNGIIDGFLQFWGLMF